MTDVLAPLTPADCDLRDFVFMPLDVVRLRDSDIALKTTGEEFRSAVMLWCASWHQVPAGSLPNDDRSLASLAGFGRAVGEWEKVRDGALRGWIECSDGRLYHPVVCEKARESWDSKLQHSYDKLVDRLRKLNKRREESGLPAVSWPSFEEWKAAGRPMDSEIVPAESKPSSGGTQPEGDRNTNRIPAENALKGQVREGISINTPHNPPSPVGDEGHPSAQKKERLRRPKSTFKTFIDQCKAVGEKPVSDYAALLRYVDKVQLPMEFVDLCWQEFKSEFLPGGKSEAKRQADWRAHFLNFVRKNYYRLWFVKDGQYVLTTAGEQAKLCHAPGTQASSGND
ncbi:YdaU family protein [Cupriavidus gilardii]|uniref:YdaU family protein n=1 Tax=Cupriavidus gilardii TaxID=82541 RepID=UPI0021B43DA4|nr:YdaU family protein [Cupriavidus gilardii]UXC37335.1 YdaU family protein [Cupriavidus gilardii]